MSELLYRDARILVVDDDADANRLIQTVLQMEGYLHLQCLRDPRGVIAAVIEFEPDLIILDLMMPHIDGFELLRVLCHEDGKGLAQTKPIPILVVSALTDSETRHRALSDGAVDVFGKPFKVREFLLHVASTLRLSVAYRRQQEEREQALLQHTRKLEMYQLELKEAHLEVIARLARAAEHRDDDTGQHTQRVGLTSALIAQAMGLTSEPSEKILRAAALHDVGKIGIPDNILLKPGKLTSEEFEVMKLHCMIGADLLSSGHSEEVRLAERIALSHHEKWNGTGYPMGLAGENIPLEGRIVAVADVFDALTRDRPYKKAWPVEKTVEEIQAQSGQHFDPGIVEAFLSLEHELLQSG